MKTRITKWTASTIVAAVLACWIGTIQAADITPGMYFNFDAALDASPTNGTWESTTTNQTRNWNVADTNAPGDVIDPFMAELTKAYIMPGSRATSGTYNGVGQNEDATFELWFATPDLTDNHVLFKTGGNGAGASMVLSGNTLYFTAQTNSTTAQMQVSTTLDIERRNHFNQFVGVIDRQPGDAAQIDMYLNGAFIGSDTLGSGFTGWAGGANSGLGRDNGTVAGDNIFGGTFADFNGRIAVHRYYRNTTLSAPQVARNYNAIYNGVVLDGLSRNYVAGSSPDGDNDNQWEDTTGKTDFQFTFPAGAQTPVVVSDATAPGIKKTYVLPAGRATTPNAQTPLGTTLDAVFELWFKPDNLNDAHVLFEVGGTGDGTSITLDDAVLRFISQGGVNRMTTTTTLNSGHVSRWNQVLGVLDVQAAGAGAMTLYLNGAKLATDTIASGYVNWAGNSPGGVGMIGSNFAGNDVVTGAVNFDGQIAVVRYYENKTFTDSETVQNYFALSGGTPTIGWDAADGPTSGTWNPTVGAGRDWTLTTAPAKDTSPATNYPGITETYVYDGDENVRATSSWAGLGNTDSASFEIWFKPDGLSNGKQVLWETGGVNGASLTIHDAQLRFGTSNSADSPDEVAVVDTLTSADIDEFIQAIGVVDMETGQTRLYINSVLMDTDSNVTSNWSGGNAAGLGTRQDTATGGFNNSGTAGGSDEGVGAGAYGTFLGDIAIFNYYQFAMNDAQVRQLYRAVIPEPSSFLLAAVGLLALLGIGGRGTKKRN